METWKRTDYTDSQSQRGGETQGQHAHNGERARERMDLLEDTDPDPNVWNEALTAKRERHTHPQTDTTGRQ